MLVLFGGRSSEHAVSRISAGTVVRALDPDRYDVFCVYITRQGLWRYVTCMPKDYINDCHVINAVWSSQLGKWLWIDPEFNAWVTDEQGNLLSIQEVRENLRNGTPVVLNKEANWNNQNKETTEEYLYNYMAKNLYYLIVSANQEYGLEDHAVPNAAHMICLVPTGFSSSHTQGLVVSDDAWFWQGPQ